MYLSDLRYIHPVIGSLLAVGAISCTALLGWAVYESRDHTEATVVISQETREGWVEAEILARDWAGSYVRILEQDPEGSITVEFNPAVKGMDATMFAQALIERAVMLPGYEYREAARCVSNQVGVICKLVFSANGTKTRWIISASVNGSGTAAVTTAELEPEPPVTAAP